MEQTTKRFSLLREGSDKLEELRKERQALSSDLYVELDKAEKLLGRIGQEKLDEVGEEMAKIDEGLTQYKDYKQTIAELSEVLTSELSEYVALASESENYQGFEKFLSLFSFTKKKADKMRIERIQTSSPRENLRLILDYGEQLFNEIREVRDGAIETFSRLQTNVDILTQKIADYEPQEAELKEKLEAMESAHKAKKESSSPTRNSSTTTLSPALPNWWRSIMSSMALSASAWLAALTTPLPAASPSALMTTGVGSVRAKAFAAAASVQRR